MNNSKHRPVDLMRLAFGTGPEEKTCCDCCNIIAVQMGNRRIYKCLAYGATCSNASDWRNKWPTCGMFGKFVQEPAITQKSKLAFSRSGKIEMPIEGQIEMGEPDENQ